MRKYKQNAKPTKRKIAKSKCDKIQNLKNVNLTKCRCAKIQTR